MQGDDGYRVTSVRWDPVLRQGWAMVAVAGIRSGRRLRCRRVCRSQALKSAEGTALTELLDGPLVVRAGDTVRLWRQEDELRIEVAACCGSRAAAMGKSDTGAAGAAWYWRVRVETAYGRCCARAGRCGDAAMSGCVGS